ncbi:TIR domain-containing protein [Actinokineospora terrae]|uniref:Predicted nucleotide-binding protein containing TIR-like domain-containing protein n=1 Tax=Actinokineospora terrae TaxID=155974 RepID=A0A1H9X309_9PSEU|nr:nucleotide-binding protein [Actinokineospora terrae]SES40023.1 Predicted nucleotide-binding protein containing TIR-like domain-containing protein [Actinokineospora terrae]
MSTSELSTILGEVRAAPTSGSFALTSRFVDSLAEVFPLPRRDLNRVVRVLVDRCSGPASAYQMRTGTWRVELAPAVAKAVVAGAISTAALAMWGVAGIPTAVLSAVAALLFAVRSVELEAGDVVVYAHLSRVERGPRSLAELRQALPADIRAELGLRELSDIVERLHRAGVAEWAAEGISIRAGGGRGLRLVFDRPLMDSMVEQVVAGESGGQVVLERKIFVVHGRDGEVEDLMFDFLRSLNLEPQEWEPLVSATGSASPYLGDVVAKGLSPGSAQAVVVLLTPDDVVTLHPDLRHQYDTVDETGLVLQPRPNVLIELGMALSAYRERTVIVEFGRRRRIADLDGLNVIRFDGSSPEIGIGKLVERLKLAGCAVDDRGSHWRRTNRFTGLAAYGREPGQ